jgi:uncharacterized protein (TIGR02996 family)
VTDRDALFTAVHADPAEDAPRLALSDWLVENGATEADRARGEYIRLAFQLDGHPKESPEQKTAAARYHELNAKYAETWFAPLLRYVHSCWTWHGFMEGVRIRGQQLSQWDRHMRWCPTIRHLVLRHCRGRLAPILNAPLSARLKALDVGGVDTADLGALAACPHLSGLKLLKLHWATVDDVVALLRSPVLPIRRVLLSWYGNELDELPTLADGLCLWVTSFSMRWQSEHLARLWACPGWAQVRHLWLPYRTSQNQRIADPLGEILEGAPHLTGVTVLSLSGNALDDEQARALARCPSLTALTNLHLPKNRIGDAGAEALVARWPNLTFLNLAENAIGSRGARAIAEGTTRLEGLNLQGNNVFLPGMVALAQSPHLAGLKELYLDGNPGDSLGASALAASPHLKPGVAKIKTDTPIQSDSVLEELEAVPEASAITVLKLKDSGITDRGLRALARNTYLTGVTELRMNFCRITKAGLDALAQWPGLRTLKTFEFGTSVNYTCCRGKDFEQLFRSPHWGDLEYLKIIAGHRLHDEGMALLTQAQFAPTLRELNLIHHEITDKGAAVIARAGCFRSVRELNLGWGKTFGPKGIAALLSGTWPGVEEVQGDNLTNKELKALGTAEGFPALMRIKVSGDKLTRVGVRALANSPLFPRLTGLDLGGKSLNDGSVQELIKAPKRPRGLVRLCLGFGKITTAGVKALVNSTLVKSATDLVLGDGELGPEFGHIIAAARNLTGLESLSLDDKSLGDAGVLALVRAKSLPALKRLWLGTVGCTEACLDELVASPLFKQVDELSVRFKMRGEEQRKRAFKERLGEKGDVR